MNGSSDYELDWVNGCYYTQDLCCHLELDDCSQCPEKQEVNKEVFKKRTSDKVGYLEQLRSGER